VSLTALQAYGVVRFLLEYALPVGCFAYCYGRIFHTLKRRNKVVIGHVSRSQHMGMTTVSCDQNPGPIQQQTTVPTTGAKVSRREMNVLQTMVVVIACFIMCYTVPNLVKFLTSVRVSMFTIIDKA